MNRSWVVSRVLGSYCLILMTAVAVGQKANTSKPVEQLPKIEELPNPFVMSDGSLVKTREDWTRRRDEIKSLFEQYQYGHLQPRPEKMEVKLGKIEVDEEAGANVQNIVLVLHHGSKTLPLNVRLTTPIKAKTKEPLPVVVQGGVFGFRRRAGGDRPGNNNTRRRRPSPSAIFVGRGYALAEFNMNEVAVDNNDRARTVGIYQLFGEDIDCGGLMAWAWGMHRVIDMLETMPDKIDSRKVIVTGHSRYGKAALVAGAFDNRVALTVPSHSGCAGAAPYRFIYGKSEQLHNISGFAPQWFRPDFRRFVGNVDRLPIDQHMLRALVAPRALLATEGTKDSWTNPEGSQLAHLAAKSVYDFFGAGDRISIKFRPVGHIPSNEDLLDFADHIFFDKPLSEEFGKLAYAKEENAYAWTAPGVAANAGDEVRQKRERAGEEDSLIEP